MQSTELKFTFQNKGPEVIAKVENLFVDPRSFQATEGNLTSYYIVYRIWFHGLVQQILIRISRRT